MVKHFLLKWADRQGTQDQATCTLDRGQLKVEFDYTREPPLESPTFSRRNGVVYISAPEVPDMQPAEWGHIPDDDDDWF